MKTREIESVDLFAGCGGTTTGLYLAAESRGVRLRMKAVNHWPIAIETHALNHPDANHFCNAIEGLDPWKVVPGGKLDLLVASPPCVHYSRARGGKPVDDQQRTSPWHVLNWVELLKPKVILIENVPDFASWGPIGMDHKPLKSKKGETFAAWLKALASLGYRTTWKVVNCADFGDATTRKRLFVLAKRGTRTPVWPTTTHAIGGGKDLFGGVKAWKPARDVIDWSLKGTSIFGRKRPLSANTLRRIEAGLKKFCGLSFLLPQFGGSTPRDVGQPLSVVTTTTRGMALVQPFLMHTTHHGGDRVMGVDDPLSTLTCAHRGEQALIEPFIVPTNYGERAGQAPRCHDIDEPVPTVVAGGVSHALIRPYLVSFKEGIDRRVHDVSEPLPTQTCEKQFGIAEPFLVQYHGSGKTLYPVSEPLRTVDCKARYGLVTPHGVLDILFRMLQPHELAAAHSFPRDYRFAGNKSEKVKQIGNSVPVCTAESLTGGLLDEVLAA